ncbi:unnamed protein product [Peronospora belbahrii]|nr:unnamed protein product [Peronospora belbahrii]
MKTWSEEWKAARLRLHLRDKQLIQGETVNMQVCADVMLSSSGSKTLHNKLKETETATQLLQRWREHCDGACVHIQVIEVSKPDSDATSSALSPAILFRQETQIIHVSLDDAGNSEAELVVMLGIHFDLTIHHEFWDRSVLLTVHMTPKIGVVHVAEGANSLGLLSIGLRDPAGASLLRDEWARSQLLSLTRKKAQPTPLMTRRVEQRIVVTKPLQLEVNIRELAERRVGILAQASNTHSKLALAVTDVHIHLDQSLQAQDAASGEVSRFCIVSGDQVPFPVMLQPQECYNFLFVLEPTEVMMREESGDDEQGTVMSTTLQKKFESPVAHRASSTQQHALLKLSWQANAVSMNDITEDHTIVWCPKVPSHSFFSSLLSGENEPQTDFQSLVTYVLKGHVKQGEKPNADFKCVRLLPDSALQTTIVPLASSISIGDAAKVCVTVTNRSMRSDFDLTLVLPTRSKDGGGRTDGAAAPAAVGFESSHRLG